MKKNNHFKKYAIAIDGHSLSYRAYYATVKSMEKYLSDDFPIPKNAVKLMMQMCLKLLKMCNYQFSIVAFDTSAPTFRKLAFNTYKANRKKIPSMLVDQIPLIMESLQYMGFTVMSADGWEADDLIGSFVHLMTKNNVQTNIFSSDHDLLQLVGENSSLFMPIKGVSEIREYNFHNFSNLFHGLTPQQVPYFKALVGDSSDNYAGVKGIGKKTAISLLKKYGDLDGIFKNSLHLSRRHYQLLSDQLDNLKLCLNLSFIKQNYFSDAENINKFSLHEIDVDAIKKFTKKFSINGLEKWL